MSDRELLELAAKSINARIIDWEQRSDGSLYALINDGAGDLHSWWSPLADDGDALRLETKLSFSAVEWADGIEVGELETVSRGLRFIKGRSAYVKLNGHNGDKLAARRLAGVRAAAEIGRAM